MAAAGAPPLPTGPPAHPALPHILSPLAKFWTVYNVVRSLGALRVFSDGPSMLGAVGDYGVCVHT